MLRYDRNVVCFNIQRWFTGGLLVSLLPLIESSSIKGGVIYKNKAWKPYSECSFSVICKLRYINWWKQCYTIMLT